MEYDGPIFFNISYAVKKPTNLPLRLKLINMMMLRTPNIPRIKPRKRIQMVAFSSSLPVFKSIHNINIANYHPKSSYGKQAKMCEGTYRRSCLVIVCIL